MTNEKMTIILDIMKCLDVVEVVENEDIKGNANMFYFIKDLDNYSIKELKCIKEVVDKCVGLFAPTTIITMIKDNAMWHKRG